MKRIKNWLKSPLGAGIATTVLAFILSVIYDLLKNEPVLTLVSQILQNVLNFILFILNFQLSVWLILLVVAAIIFVIYILYKIDERKEPPLPPFIDYTSDTLMDIKWRWRWERMSDGKYDITNLQPMCRYCDSPLYEDYSKIKCIRCKSLEYKPIPEFDLVKSLICDNVDKRSYKKSS